MHSDRFLALKQSIAEVYQRILQDDILKTLSQNVFSECHIPDRIQEIFSEVIETDRETFITLLFEEKERISQENTQNLEKIANLLKEIAQKESKIKQHCEKYDELTRANRVLEVKSRENEGILAEIQRDKEEIMRLSSEIAVLKVGTKEKERYIGEITLEKDNLVRETREKERKIKSLEETQQLLESKILEFETWALQTRGELDKNQEKSEILSRKLEFEEKNHLELLDRTKEALRSELEISLSSKNQEIQSLKRAIEEIQQLSAEKLGILKSKNLKYKQSLKAVEQNVRAYEKIIEEDRKLQEDFERKIEELQGTIAKLELRSNENQEKKKSMTEELKNAHKLTIDRLQFEERKKTADLNKLTEEKEKLVKKLEESKLQNNEKTKIHDEEKRELMVRIQERERKIDTLTQKIDSISTENELLIKSTKEFEIVTFREKREAEAKCLEIQGLVKERDLKIESLEASLKNYKENEESLKRKFDNQESAVNKKRSESENEIKKLKEMIETLKIEIQRKEKEISEKKEQFLADKIKISQESQKSEILFKEQIQQNQILKQENKELIMNMEKLKNDTLLLRRTRDEFKVKMEAICQEKNHREREIIDKEMDKTALKSQIESLIIQRTELETLLSDETSKVASLENAMKVSNENLLRKIKRFQEIIFAHCKSIRSELSSIQTSQKSLILEAVLITETYFKDFVRLSQSITEKKLSLQNQEQVDKTTALELSKRREILQIERNLLESRVNPLEKAFSLEKARNFEAETVINQKNMEISLLKDELDDLKNQLFVKNQDLEQEKDEKIKDYKTFEAKLSEKDQELSQKTQQISLLSSFLVKLKAEILAIMSKEKEKEQNAGFQRKKELEFLKEYIKAMQKFLQKKLCEFSLDIESLSEQNEKEIKDFQRVIEKQKDQIKSTQAALTSSSHELEIKSGIIKKQKELFDNLSEKFEVLQIELEEKSLLLMETHSSQIKEKKPIEEIQRKVASMQEDLIAKTSDLKRVCEENIDLKQTIKGLEMQLKLKTQNYENIKEESFKETKRTQEELDVWKKIAASKKQIENQGKLRREKWDEKGTKALSQHIKDLQILGKGFDV